MTRAEFRKRLGQLQEVITRGLTYYAVWKNLRLHDEGKASWSLEEQNQVLGRFRGFFTPAGFALLDMTLMQFAKVFDTDPKTASLLNLLGAARQDASLVSGHTSAEVDAVSRQFRQSKRIRTALERMRNQQLAHVDADPAPVDRLLTAEFDGLVEHVESAFNWLSRAHDGRLFSWEQSLRDVERHTTDVLGILREEMERKQKEHQEEMVRIVLEAIRSREMLLGWPLDKEEMRSLIQSYGLTEEQMHRIEEERGLS